MNSTRMLLQVAEHRTPLIKFVGKRSPQSSLSSPSFITDALITLHASEPADPTPHAHPASPSSSLPDSFVQYRSKAQQHGPLGHRSSSSASSSSSSAAPTSSSSSAASLAYGAIGGHSGKSLGSVDPPKGQFFDRSELPARFGRMKWTGAEIEAVETGGASVVA